MASCSAKALSGPRTGTRDTRNQAAVNSDVSNLIIIQLFRIFLFQDIKNITLRYQIIEWLIHIMTNHRDMNF
jgi:hypothetical protein